jgi:hypothetical protein
MPKPGRKPGSAEEDMKRKLVALALIALCALAVVGCGHDRVVNGKVCETYGILNDQVKCPGVRYCTVAGNVVWGILLSETVFAPVYFFGFSVKEPCAVQ